MSRKSFILAALAIILVMASACSSTPTALNLSGTDNGTTVEVKQGGQIVIKLDGNPSTGYTWEAQNLDTTIFKQTGDSVFANSNPGLVGSGGTLTLTFETLKVGTSTLNLVYHRPWETGVDPINTYSITVTVK